MFWRLQTPVADSHYAFWGSNPAAQAKHGNRFGRRFSWLFISSVLFVFRLAGISGPPITVAVPYPIRLENGVFHGDTLDL